MGIKRFSINIDEKTYEKVVNISQSTGKSVADVTRELINKGLASEWNDENVSLISSIVRQQLNAVLKPHVERLAALESKTAHAAATAMFLNVQAFMDLLPPEKKKEPKEMYEKARKKAVEYVRTPLANVNDQEK